MGEASGTPVVMDYWKNYITIHHVMACELSYSLIYDNIRPDKLTDALATVGLTRSLFPHSGGRLLQLQQQNADYPGIFSENRAH